MVENGVVGLWQARVKKHQTKMMRYMRLVFNDHFIIALLVLLGAFAYGYSNILRRFNGHIWWGRPLVIVIFTLSLMLGKLATLVQEADIVFLLPKEKQMADYLQKTISHSLLLPVFWLAMIAGFTAPLLVATNGNELKDFLPLWLMLIVLKLADLFLQEGFLYQTFAEKEWLWQGIQLFVHIVSIALSLYVNLWAGLVLGLLWCTLVVYGVRSKKHGALLWEKMIQTEVKRLYRIYQFINLFTDVPVIQPKARRRRYLDFLTKNIQRTQKNTFKYLYTISFIRSGEYSGLFLRLSILGVICLVFLQNFWVALVFSLLFIYLIGFQLLPLYYKYDHLLFVQIYPLDIAVRLTAIKGLLWKVLSFTSVLFGLASLFALPEIWMPVVVLLAGLVFAYLFSQFYVPKRLTKNQY